MTPSDVDALSCAPRNAVRFGTRDAPTCFSKADLRALARALQVSAPASLSKAELLDRLHAALDDRCYNEACWLTKAPSSVAQRLAASLRPPRPQEWTTNPGTWLTNHDIAAVMTQYESLYSDLAFLGVFPVDFNLRDAATRRCIGGTEYLCVPDVHSHLRRLGKSRFAMVINLDRHDQPGSHWVALYCDLRRTSPNYGIFYYDSVAPTSGPPDTVRAFMRGVADRTSDDGFRVAHNVVRHQRSNNECGMFAMVFLTQCFKNSLPIERIYATMRDDDDMNRLRSVLFSAPAARRPELPSTAGGSRRTRGTLQTAACRAPTEPRSPPGPRKARRPSSKKRSSVSP